MRNIILIIFRDKVRILIYISLIFVFISLYFIIFFIKDYYDYQIYEILGHEKENRELLVTNSDEKLQTLLKEMDNIESFIPRYSLVNIDGKTINVYNNEKIIIGREIKNNNEILISKYYYNILKLQEDDLNKKTININDENYLVVGIVENNNSNIYMNEFKFKNYNNKIVNYLVLVDKFSNVENVSNYLNEKGYFNYLNDSSKLMVIEEMKNAQKVYNYILCFSITSLIIILYFIIKKMYYEEEKNISLLKALGYRTSIINFISSCRILILLFIPNFIYIIGYIFIKILLYFLPYSISIKNFMLYLKFLKYLNIEIVIILIMIMIYLLVYTRKIKKINPMQMFNE